MLLNLLVLNVFIMFCSWLLVTYNQPCRIGRCGLEHLVLRCNVIDRSLGYGNHAPAAGSGFSGVFSGHLVFSPDLASAAPLYQ